MQATLVNPLPGSANNISVANNLVTAALRQANEKSIALGALKALGAPPAAPSAMVDFWHKPVRIELNHFKHKSLSAWKCNISIGCQHACRFCYVPAVSTKFQKPVLKARYGVADPDAQWGDYVLLRPLDEAQILKDIRAAEKRPLSELSPDGNRAVMLCTTTDAYQTITSPNKELQRRLNADRAHLVRRTLELIRDHSTLNVRILTRSPLARQDFDLFKSFGNRLLFGMSVPTLNNRLARIYEPNAPSPTQRLATLQAARDLGLNIFVAVAPTYAECDEADLRATLTDVKALSPRTIYHEPINVRADNIARIARHAEAEGQVLNTAVFDTPNDWRAYAMDSLRMVQRLAQELGLEGKLHLWPDAELQSENCFHEMRKAAWTRQHPDAVLTKEQRVELKRLDEAAYAEHVAWLEGWWSRISEWPGVARTAWTPPALPASPFTVPALHVLSVNS
ncbi:MAG: hypothetical protein RL514_3467 [Verrucomicrobiota bacterium]